MLSALSQLTSSTSISSGANSGSNYSAQIAALESQIAAYTRQLAQAKEEAASDENSQEAQRLEALIANLEALASSSATE